MLSKSFDGRPHIAAFVQVASLRRALRLALKLNIALLGDRRLFDRNHLALHLGQFGCILFVASHEEGRRARR
jgi:hypothetical protein